MRVPYKEIAFFALVNWNGKTEQEANKMVNLMTVDELETYVGAKGSVNHAIDSIATNLRLSEEDKKELTKAVYEGPVDAPIFGKVYGLLGEVKDLETFVLGILSDIHNGWVQDHADEATFNKKVTKRQLRQYTPLPLIGYNEVLSDLIFLRPILMACGINPDELQLEGAYHLRMHDFLIANRIFSLNDLEARIATGSMFYPSLPGELAQKLSPMAHDVTEQLRENWYDKDKSSATTFLIVQREEIERKKAASTGNHL